jgi:two-component sensor histidine kinase
VNELVTNAVKYAFPGNRRGTVLVTLKRAPGELRLTVADNGQGADPRADSGLGGRLVERFAQQLGGQRPTGAGRTRIRSTNGPSASARWIHRGGISTSI